MKKFVLAAVTCGLLSVGAFAQTFVTPGGATDSAGEMVNAKATFVVDAGAGTVTVHLWNLLTAAEMHSVGQSLSDLKFTLSGTGYTGAAISSTSPYQDQLITVANDGSVTLAGTTNQLGWGLLGSNGSYTLEDLGFAGPKNTLLGGTAGSLAPYSNANASIAGNGPHNPYLQGQADWVINIAGLTADTQVTDAVFSFGTTLGDDVKGTPEPATLGLVAVGFAALIRRRKARV